MHNRYAICKVTFGFLFGVGKSRINAMRKHYMEYGMEGWIHKNTKRLPSKTASHKDIVRLVTFMPNYTEANAILLPGRIPGYKRDDLKLLPSDVSKKVSVTVC